MNWDAIGAIAELLGAIGVIASLVYLATQTRQNSSAVRMSNYMQLNTQLGSFVERIADDNERHDLWQRGNQSYDDLSAEERELYHTVLGSYFTHYETLQRLWDRGQIDAELYEEMFQSAVRMLEMPGPKHWWMRDSSWFAPSFRAALNDRVETSATHQKTGADSP
jgi:hypothetical protein